MAETEIGRGQLAFFYPTSLVYIVCKLNARTATKMASLLPSAKVSRRGFSLGCCYSTTSVNGWGELLC